MYHIFWIESYQIKSNFIEIRVQHTSEDISGSLLPETKSLLRVK